MKETTAHLEVRTTDRDGQYINTINGEDASYEQTAVLEKDRFKKLLGDANARISVSLSEKIGGPYGYSSVSINVTVTLTCSQNATTIEAAHVAAFEECVSLIDCTVGHSMEMLNAHLQEHYREGGP